MKRSSLIINTARGGICHEGDLELALREGRLGGAGIDVWEQEPRELSSFFPLFFWWLMPK